MHVVFVAPYVMPNTLRYVRALLDIPGVRLSLLTIDERARLASIAPDVAQRIVAMVPVNPSLDADALCAGIAALPASAGRPMRLLGMLEQLQLPLGVARTRMGIPGMGAEAARNFRDKDRMKEVLRAAGLPVARHQRIESVEAAHAFVAEVGYPLILKPIAGVGARSTYRVNDEGELRDVLRKLNPTRAQAVQAEEFIVGIERTLEVVMKDGRPIWWSGTRYHPTPLAVLENPWMQYTVTLPREEGEPWSGFLATSVAALKALGLETGLSHMEWFETADGRYVIGEVGARPPGVQIMPLMSLGYGVDMVRAWCRLMVLGEWTVGSRRRAAGCAFFRAQGAGSRIVAIRGLDEAQAAVGHLVADRQLPQLGAAAAESYEGDGWAIVTAETTEEVQAALGTLVRTVRIVKG